jgi:2-amino-4-hydroxy-6-hydroxymethyldihydropteridine diphosphokinase
VAKVYLSLGSNLGDRAEYLRAARRQIANHPQIEVEAQSKIYETQSVEGGGSADFFNAALRVSTSLDPHELLRFLNSVEENLGRPQPPRNGPRAIDIDILLYGDKRISDEMLTLPHPRMHARVFVLMPLLEVLEGGWVKATNADW